jgi:hypothetical protein
MNPFLPHVDLLVTYRIGMLQETRMLFEGEAGKAITIKNL